MGKEVNSKLGDKNKKKPKAVISSQLMNPPGFGMKKIITMKKPLSTYYPGEDVTYYEGCDLLGYMEYGDSFLFSQGMGFEKGRDKRVVFAVSRNSLECLLKDHPKRSSD